jgi:hypothetical protein
VRVRETVARVDEYAEHLRGTVRLGPLRERLSFDELHRDEQLAVRVADVMHCDDVRMLEPRERLRFGPQPFVARRGAAEHLLHSDLALEISIVRCVDDAHATVSQLVEDRVAAELHGGS